MNEHAKHNEHIEHDYIAEGGRRRMKLGGRTTTNETEREKGETREVEENRYKERVIGRRRDTKRS
jgi:hypothetical protein